MLASISGVRVPVSKQRVSGLSRGCRQTVPAHASTIWQVSVSAIISDTQLAPDSRWCKEHAEECAVLTPLIDLTGPLGTKTFCTVGTERDHVECDGVIHTEDDGVFLVFEARGATNPLDSPSALFVTDVSEDGCVYLNGGELPKKIAVQVQPGAVLQLGQHTVYQVLRNYTNHA